MAKAVKTKSKTKAAKPQTAKPKGLKEKMVKSALQKKPKSNGEKVKRGGKEKYVYSFGANGTDGDAGMKNLLGGKGANLAEMTSIGLPVPGRIHHRHRRLHLLLRNDQGSYPPELRKTVDRGHGQNRKGDGRQIRLRPTNPLLVSCRSGARESMPGMMDTVLNIGLNDTTVEALAKQSGNERFAWDSYRRFVQMYGDVVLGHEAQDKEDHDPFEHAAGSQEGSSRRQVRLMNSRAEQLKELVAEFKTAIKERHRQGLPQRSACDQIWGAIGAVFGSWMNDRAVVYRRTLRHSARVGHSRQRAGHGVRQPGRRLCHRRGLTRDCSAGERRVQRRLPDQRPGRRRGGRYPHAQADRRDAEQRHARRLTSSSNEIGQSLEKHYKEVQDIEFTVQRGKRLDAADPQRQADRFCRRADRRRPGQRRPDQQGSRP